MERDKTVTASFTTAFWIAPSASSLWLPQNDLNLQIVQSLFSGSLYYSQAKKEMEISAAVVMTDSVGWRFLLSQDGAYYPSDLVKWEWDSALSFHSSLWRLRSIETVNFTYYTIWSCGICFLFKNDSLKTIPFHSFQKKFPFFFQINKLFFTVARETLLWNSSYFCFLRLPYRDKDISVGRNNRKRTVLELDWLDLLKQIRLNLN